MGALNCSLRCREVQSQTIKDNCGERNQMTCWIGRRTFGWYREGLKIWFLLRFSSNIGWPANFEHIRHKTLVFIDQTILRLHYYLAFNWVTFLGLCSYPSQCKLGGARCSFSPCRLEWHGVCHNHRTFPNFQLSDRLSTFGPASDRQGVQLSAHGAPCD